MTGIRLTRDSWPDDRRDLKCRKARPQRPRLQMSEALMLQSVPPYVDTLDDQGLLMFRRDHLGDGSLIKRHPVKGGIVPPRKGPLVIWAVAAHIAKGSVSRKHEQESQQMGDKLALWFLGLLETTQYTLEQSHGVPPISVVLGKIGRAHV